MREVIDFRVCLRDGAWTNWRKLGCDSWRLNEANARFLTGEYSNVETRFDDGSTVKAHPSKSIRGGE